MKVWTYEEARDKVLKDLDLEDEDFVQPDELVGYFNEAIDEAEAEIHKLRVEDEYFIKNAFLELTEGEDEYALPDDIYGNKIRSVIYSNGSEKYEIKRIRRKNKFMIIADADSADLYRYTLKNPDASTGVQFQLVPESREDSTENVTIWYIRNANRIPLISEGSLSITELAQIDIPEFINFVFAFVKVKCMKKEDHPGLGLAMEELRQQREQMINTLTQAVVDDDEILEADFSSYEDMN